MDLVPGPGEAKIIIGGRNGSFVAVSLARRSQEDVDSLLWEQGSARLGSEPQSCSASGHARWPESAASVPYRRARSTVRSSQFLRRPRWQAYTCSCATRKISTSARPCSHGKTTSCKSTSHRRAALHPLLLLAADRQARDHVDGPRYETTVICSAVFPSRAQEGILPIRPRQSGQLAAQPARVDAR